MWFLIKICYNYIMEGWYDEKILYSNHYDVFIHHTS